MTRIAFLMLCVCLPAAVSAQPAPPPAPALAQGTFPDGTFGVTLRKYLPAGNDLAAFYSWDADMALRLTVFRRGVDAADFDVTFQSVGTENFGSRVSVGGTGYLFGFGYTRVLGTDTAVSVGIRHLSSHLTRDLDEKIADETNDAARLPSVRDPSEYNAIFFRLVHRWRALPLDPEVEVRVAPVDVRFNGKPQPHLRPVYLRSRWMAWRGAGTAFVVETQHEFGTRPFNHFTAAVEMHAREEEDGRLQLFISGSSGSNMHVSPWIGGLRDGVAFGVRLKFQTK